jgi:acyl carrier protein
MATGPQGTFDGRFNEIIMVRLGVSDNEITPDASFENDLGADSLDAAELVMAFEEEYNIEIPDDDAVNFCTTVGKARSYILGRLGYEKWKNHPAANAYGNIDEKALDMVLNVLGKKVDRESLKDNPIKTGTNIYKSFGAGFWDTWDLLHLFDNAFGIWKFPETDKELEGYAGQDITFGRMCDCLRSRVGPAVIHDLYKIGLSPEELSGAIRCIFNVSADYRMLQSGGYKEAVSLIRDKMHWDRVEMQG